jgi:hypothetical protein
MNVNELETGDIILVTDSSTGIFNYFLNMIKYATHSNYTHIALIVKDPHFLNKPLKGVYLWESSFEGTPDPQDDKIKLGVQLTEINEFKKNYGNSSFFIRKLKNKSVFTNEKLKEIHSVAYDKPYDINILDWIYALFRKDKQPQKTSRFWCSAFVGYIFVKCNILKEDTDWSIMYPNDFSLSGENLNYKSDNKLIENEIKLNL